MVKREWSAKRMLLMPCIGTFSSLDSFKWQKFYEVSLCFLSRDYGKSLNLSSVEFYSLIRNYGEQKLKLYIGFVEKVNYILRF